MQKIYHQDLWYKNIHLTTAILSGVIYIMFFICFSSVKYLHIKLYHTRKKIDKQYLFRKRTIFAENGHDTLSIKHKKYA